MPAKNRRRRKSGGLTAADGKGYGARMAIAAQILGLTEEQAATDYGITLATYRSYVKGSPQRSITPTVRFAHKYNVSLDWLVAGDGVGIKPHLYRGGKIAILPTVNRRWREAVQS